MVGDAAGVPLSVAGRWRADSWSPDDLDTAEWVSGRSGRDTPWRSGKVRAREAAALLREALASCA
jgi:hypothetical protein